MVVLMKVINVKFNNNKVEIVLENKSFLISKENYIENPVSIDSYVDEDRIDFLLRQEKIIESKIELIKLLNRKALTEYEIIVKLKDKNHKSEEIELIVYSLKRAGLINDEYCGTLIVEGLLFRRKGVGEIKKGLKEKGINSEIINKLIDEIDRDVYVGNFNKVCEKYSKMYSTKSSTVKFQLIKNKLRDYGYEKELIDTLICEENIDQEIVNAKKNLLRMLKNKNIDLDNYENINKIKSKLVMKGFNYDIINLVLEEVIADETN